MAAIVQQRAPPTDEHRAAQSGRGEVGFRVVASAVEGDTGGTDSAV